MTSEINQPRFPNCYKAESKPHKFCPGCGHPIVLKMIGQAIDELGIAKETVFLIDIGCSLLAWDVFDLPTSQTHHGRTVPTAVGFKKAEAEREYNSAQGKDYQSYQTRSQQGPRVDNFFRAIMYGHGKCRLLLQPRAPPSCLHPKGHAVRSCQPCSLSTLLSWLFMSVTD